MQDQIRKCFKFIDYWWFRWCLATEMYMVEKWERWTISILIQIQRIIEQQLAFSLTADFPSRRSLSYSFHALLVLQLQSHPVHSLGTRIRCDVFSARRRGSTGSSINVTNIRWLSLIEDPLQTSSRPDYSY